MMVCGIKCRIFFFKQKTAYEMRISDWSSDVCSSDLEGKKTDSRLLFVYSNAPQNVIVRNDSGVKSLADLKGKRFNPGLKGSATEKTAEAVFKALGIAPEFVRGSTTDIVDAVKDNRDRKSTRLNSSH